jgi:transcription initiation factor TFIIB
MLKDKLALSNAVVEKAAYIYRKIQERGLVRGRTI